MRYLKSMNIEELQEFMAELSYPQFRAKQIFGWIHEKKVDSIDEMNNIPKDLKETLKTSAIWDDVTIVKTLVSKKDETRKYVCALRNDALVESVFMKYKHGNTVCISTQAGCRMGCRFCASTLEGVECNLTAGEMLSQVYAIEKDCGERISGVVMMGSGEPLDNYEASMKFIRLINDPKGHNMGQRHITLSTCGLISKIEQLAEEGLQITLAISLHSHDNETRKQLMPIAKKNPMDDLLLACEHYMSVTKRRITFEYALIHGVNDTEGCAKELAAKLRDMMCHVNLIPMNEVKESRYEKSQDMAVSQFMEVLQREGIEVTLRRKLGEDINGACGQLRRGL
ncbi:MAG: 23S rRNA (adenine(2503)-C(2))-methyltransferase RlmN [Bacillota bacterium]